MGYFGATNRDGYLLKGIRIFIAYWICGWAIAIQQLLAVFLVFRSLLPPYGVAKRTLDMDKGVITIDGERTIHLLDLPLAGWPLVWGTLAGLTVLVTGTYFSNRRSLQPLALRSFSLKPFIPWLGLAFLLGVISSALERSFPDLRSGMMERLLTSSLDSTYVTIIAIGVLVPLFEELIFRGLMFSKLEAEFNSNVAVVVTSVLFLLVHLQYSVLVLLVMLPLALILGMVRYRTGSVWPSFIIHSLNNLAGILIIAAQS
ncbi:MAG TPA: type II CAAX endopeptidase family protein [Flavobacteriales bacterium]|nr:type II CAAX endopeptidase family protein [Flavobacteriales bacterium]